MVLLVVVAVAFSGCFASLDSPLARGRLDPDEAGLLDADGNPYRDATPLRWAGARLVAPASTTWVQLTPDTPCFPSPCGEEAPCGNANCEVTPFEARVPPGWEGSLEVAIRWPTTERMASYALRIEDASGAVVARAPRTGYGGSLALVALLDDPAPGRYAAVVQVLHGEGEYEGVVQLEARAPRDGVVRDLLPDIVTLPPTDLSLVTPDYVGAGNLQLLRLGAAAQAADATGSAGCRLDERAAPPPAPRRCLRFTNAVANLGEGPLEIRLSLPDGASSSAGGRFVQRIYATDGSSRESPAGPAEWHATHAHWHNAASNRFVVHPYDLERGTRGPPLGEGTKAGICYADVGLADLGLRHTTAQRWGGVECFVPTGPDRDWAMGLSPNWYDAYPSLLPDQFVDLGSARDGVYALCSVTNPDGSLVEADPTNNEACAVFALAGDVVTVLSEEPYHAMRPD